MPEPAKLDDMNVVKLGKKGQVSIPKAVLSALHLEGEHWLIVDTTEEGAIILRPAGVAPIELYDDARIAAFLEEDELTPDLAARVEAALAALRRG
jgi:AbrB family looped-hinge helix DNA binding protein